MRYTHNYHLPLWDMEDPLRRTDINAAMERISLSLPGNLLQAYEAAGAYTWTAPDLFHGKPYRVGVLILGAGSSGAAGNWNSTTNESRYYYTIVRGGVSGKARPYVTTVTPGAAFALVVGAGGDAATVSNYSGQIVAGGSSAFDGITASGGALISDALGAAYCGQPSLVGTVNGHTDLVDDLPDVVPFGGAQIPKNRGEVIVPDYASCFNPFENRPMGAAGQSFVANLLKTDLKAIARQCFASPAPGGGLGAIDVSGAEVYGGDGVDPGSGGGAVIAAYGTGYQLTHPGRGADGAVYLYVLGVAE